MRWSWETAKTLTITDTLRAKLEAARQRERAARADAARLMREMKSADRRRETQLLCTLGRAWLALGERVPAFRDSGGRFLDGYITREADREILSGTAWEVSEPLPVPAAGNAS